jgi:adenine C2-methylase RlmN of 23S rRNA A2503 and tRNA A37
MVDMPARLAWSVHAANDITRKLLVPTTAHTMTELKDAFKGMIAHYTLPVLSIGVHQSLVMMRLCSW